METRRQLFTQLSWRKSIPNCWCWSLFDFLMLELHQNTIS
jgi:hypothetical protein